MTQDTQPGELSRASRIIDLKLPLTWLIGVACLIVTGGFGLYYQVGGQGETLREMKEQMKDLKIAVNAGNTQAMTFGGEVAIIKFRLEKIEEDRRAAK